MSDITFLSTLSSVVVLAELKRSAPVPSEAKFSSFFKGKKNIINIITHTVVFLKKKKKKVVNYFGVTY